MNSTVVFALFVATVFIAMSAAHHAPVHYHFSYGVNDPHTKDHKSQQETRNGHIVKGSYSLREPDGTKRIVEYVAGPHTGFQAVVKRLGHARHPAHYGHHQGGFGGAESYVGTTHWGHF